MVSRSTQTVAPSPEWRAAQPRQHAATAMQLGTAQEAMKKYRVPHALHGHDTRLPQNTGWRGMSSLNTRTGRRRRTHLIQDGGNELVKEPATCPVKGAGCQGGGRLFIAHLYLPEWLRHVRLDLPMGWVSVRMCLCLCVWRHKGVRCMRVEGRGGDRCTGVEVHRRGGAQA